MDVACYYSVIRYVPEPIRNEARNIGVMVVAPELQFSKARFHLSRARLAVGSPRYRLLQEIMRSYSIELQEQPRLALEGNTNGEWTRADLVTLHEECTNMVQFTEPHVIFGDPMTVLDDLYRERVMPRSARGSSVWTTRRAVDAFRRSVRQAGKDEALVQEGAPVKTSQGNFYFDVGLGNGHLAAIVQNVSLRNREIQRAEFEAGWFVLVWPQIRDELGTEGVLLLEPPDQPIREAEEKHSQILSWAMNAKVRVESPENVEEVASELALKL